jgi:hypothetical protein
VAADAARTGGRYSECYQSGVVSVGVRGHISIFERREIEIRPPTVVVGVNKWPIRRDTCGE